MNTTIKQQPKEKESFYYSEKLKCYVGYNGEKYTYFHIVDGKKVYIEPNQLRP